MDAILAHRQACLIASWLASSAALRHRLRHRLRSRLLSSSPTSPSIDFIEVVIAWVEEAPC